MRSSLKLVALAALLVASGAVGAGIYSALDDVTELADARNEPLRRFQAVEATALVKQWLGSRTLDRLIDNDCLAYHESRSIGSFEEPKIEGRAWEVSHELTSNRRFTWVVYEGRLAINPTLKPEDSTC